MIDSFKNLSLWKAVRIQALRLGRFADVNFRILSQQGHNVAGETKIRWSTPRRPAPLGS